MARLTQEQVQAEPWKYSASAYQAVMGVHQPYIAEISPMQYAHLSKRGKAQYDAKREHDWDASAACKAEWRRLVIEAHDASRFHYKDADVEPEAKHAVIGERIDRDKKAKRAAIDAALADNKITDVSQLKVGDRIFDMAGGWHGTVTKVNKVSVSYKPDCQPGSWAEGRIFKANIGSLQWKPYAEVAKSVDPNWHPGIGY